MLLFLFLLWDVGRRIAQRFFTFLGFFRREIDEERGMLLEIVAGPLKGERRRVQRDGATVGRATDSTIRSVILFAYIA